MVAVNCEDPLARCEEGNMFRTNSSTIRGTVEARVNGLPTGPLPHGERMILPNTLAGTTGQLDLIVGGQSFPMCERLQDYNFTQPRDLGLLISEVKDDASANSGGTEQDLLLLAVSPALMGMAPPEGEIAIDQAPDPVLLWAAVTILAGLEVLDEVSGTQALFESTGGNIDLRSTGTDGAPTLADAVAAVRSRNGRAAIRAMLDGGAGALRVLRDGAGRLMVLARMQRGLARQLMAGVVVAMARNRMAVVTAGTRGQLASRAATTPASRIPVVGFFIVGTIDVIEWYSNPASRGDWSLLFSTLVVDGTALVISAAVGSFIAGVVVGALTVGAVVTVGAAVAGVAAGIGAALVAGAALTWVVNRTGLVSLVDRLATATHSTLGAALQGAVQVTGTFADELARIYREIEEEVYGPGDYIGDLVEGVHGYIEGMKQSAIGNLRR